MSARAKASGAVGAVVNGRIRDLAEHRSMGYPVSQSQVKSFREDELCATKPSCMIDSIYFSLPSPSQRHQADTIFH
jgi:hypothetical protein